MDSQKLQELQIMEQTLQSFLYQKQVFQMEISETEAALKEITRSGDEVYKIVGQLMLKSNKKDVKEELEKKKKMLELRISSIEKQEKSVGDNLKKLREELVKKDKK